MWCTCFLSYFVRRLATIIESFRGFLQILQVNVGIVGFPQVGLMNFIAHPSHFIVHIILPFNGKFVANRKSL